MNNAPRRALVALGCLLTVLVAGAAAQRGRQPAIPALPPLSMTCPHHPDVIESAPGICPYCKMTLVPVRLAPAWTCPVHPTVIADTEGSCRLCKRQLVPVAVSLTWSCGGSSAERVEPGLCPDGKPMTLKRTLRPHGDHNPRHDGQFFMAPDNWHHVEGIYPANNIFRLYVYDDYARPLSRDRLGALNARVVTKERYDSTTRQTVELTAFPLKAARSGAYLEARLDSTSLPAAVSAKVRFARGGAEHRFDFTFHTFTASPAAPAVPAAAASRREGSSTTTAPRAPSARDAKTPADPGPQAGSQATALQPGPDPALVPVPIPDNVGGILEQLRARTQQVEALIGRGDFGAVWVPAFQAKDLAIALESRLDTLPASRRDATASALQRVVRISWLLDAYGDVGNRQQLMGAYSAFAAAVADAASAFAETAQR